MEHAKISMMVWLSVNDMIVNANAQFETCASPNQNFFFF